MPEDPISGPEDPISGPEHPAPRSITVVGVTSGADGLTKEALRAIEAADLLIGGRRHLATWAHLGTPQVAIEGPLGPVLDQIAEAVDSSAVCVLASGDPGFFGITRALAERFGSPALAIHPTPSSVSLAFARLGLAWDDAVVVSAHGRPLAAAAVVAARPTAHKIAVLTSPENPPRALGTALLDLGIVGSRPVAVCSRLGHPDESVTITDLDGLATGGGDALSVVVLFDGPERLSPGPSLAWGRPEEAFAHRPGMITKAEVRSVALGRLELPSGGVMWDVGAGSGSVAVECARLAPGLRVIAIERDPATAEAVLANSAAHGVTIEVILGEAPTALRSLADPDRAFVGGGGIEVLDAVLARLRPGGRVVATYAAVDRAAAAFDRLGHLSQIAVSRGVSLPDGGVRLAAENPVFVAWGPQP